MKILSKKGAFYSYLLVLILLSILPINGSSSSLNNNYIVHIRLDHFAHFGVLLPYFFLLRSEKKIINSLFALIFALIFASFLEIIQYFLTYRNFNINDLVANWIGVLFGFIVYISFYYFYRTR